LLVATTVDAGFPANDALASVTAPVAIVVATVPILVVTSPVNAGSLPAGSVPDVILAAFVVSVVADAASPVILDVAMFDKVLVEPLIDLLISVT
jgi:hypothetical protein